MNTRREIEDAGGLVKYLIEPPPTFYEGDQGRAVEIEVEGRAREDSATVRVKEVSRDIDRVYLQLKYTKNRVRVKLNASLLDLHERYYSKGKMPPIRTLCAAYKSLGYSEAFLERLVKGRARAKRLCSTPFVNAFVAQPQRTKKAKKTPTVQTEPESDASECNSDEEDTSDHEDDGFDVDTNEDVVEEPLEDDFDEEDDVMDT